MAHAPQRRHRSLWQWIALGLALGTAVAIVWSDREALLALEDISPFSLLALTAAQAVYLLSQSERLRLIVMYASTPELGIGAWTRIFVRGRLLNTVMTQSGNLYRALALKRRGIHILEYATAMAIHTWMGMTFSLAIAAIGTVLLPNAHEARLAPLLVILTVIALASPVLALRLGEAGFWGRSKSRLLHAINSALLQLPRTLRKRRLFVGLLAHTMVSFVAGAIVVTIAFDQASASITLVSAAALIAFLQVSNVISITPGNIGIQEVGFAGFSELIGYPASAGVIASVIVRVAGYLTIGILALCVELLSRSSPEVGEIDSSTE